MWVKRHVNKNNFKVLEFSSFTVFDQKIIFGKVKIVKAPVEFELMTSRFVVNALTQLRYALG